MSEDVGRSGVTKKMRLGESDEGEKRRMTQKIPRAKESPVKMTIMKKLEKNVRHGDEESVRSVSVRTKPQHQRHLTYPSEIYHNAQIAPVRPGLRLKGKSHLRRRKPTNTRSTALSLLRPSMQTTINKSRSRAPMLTLISRSTSLQILSSQNRKDFVICLAHLTFRPRILMTESTQAR